MRYLTYPPRQLRHAMINNNFNCLYLRHEDFSTKTITNEKSKRKVK